MKRAIQHLLWALATLLLINYATEWSDCAKRGGTWARTWRGNQCFGGTSP